MMPTDDAYLRSLIDEGWKLHLFDAADPKHGGDDSPRGRLYQIRAIRPEAVFDEVTFNETANGIAPTFSEAIAVLHSQLMERQRHETRTP